MRIVGLVRDMPIVAVGKVRHGAITPQPSAKSMSIRPFPVLKKTAPPWT